MPAPTGSMTPTNTTGTVRGRFVQRPNIRAARGQNDVRRESNQFRHHAANVVVIAANPAIVDLHVLLVGPAQLLQRLPKGGIASLNFHIGLHSTGKHGDAPHALALLRPRRERPPHRRAAEQLDELAARIVIRSPRRRGR